MICDLGHKPTWGGGEGIFIILPHPTVNEQLPARGPGLMESV